MVTLGIACIVLIATTNCACAAVGDELFKLLPDDGSSLDHFGWLGVDLDDGVAVVGASGDDNEAGSVYLFNVATGAQIDKLQADDRSGGDLFGWELGIHSGTALIGAPHDDNMGSAYLFDVASGLQLHKLVSDDREVGDDFGVRVAINGDFAIVASLGDDDNGMNSGAAYVFDVVSGNQLRKLVPDDGASEDGFGTGIEIDSGVAVISSYQDDDNGDGSGSTYLFDVQTGQQLRKLLPDDGAAGDWFGNGVAIDNGLVLVGAPKADVNGIDSGAAYLFDAASGAQLMKLLPEDGSQGDLFGDTVAMHNGIALIGAYRDDDRGADSGSAYLFDVSNGKQLAKLKASDGASFDRFSLALALDDGIALLGAALNDDQGQDSGAAYLFSAVPEPITAWSCTLLMISILPTQLRTRDSQPRSRG